MTVRIVSGGQTGVDRAALDVALELGMACGGWCPAGRRAEDGPIAPRYPLTETASADYAERTARNVADADATLVITGARLSGGTLLTVEAALRAGQPCLVVDLRQAADPAAVREWLALTAPATLNVAGPRESALPGIHDQARAFLRAVFAGA